MEYELWLAFASACVILCAIPGPSVLVVVSQAISNGNRAALLCILGDLAGGVCLMSLSLLGVGQIVAASPVAFQAIKWAGVAYLIYLGLRQIMSARHITSAVEGAPAPAGSFSAGFWTELFNAKSLVFYLAFLTQFVNVNAPLVPQYFILITTAATVAAVVLSGYVVFAGSAKRFISSAGSRRNFSRLSGVFYLAGGGLVAVTR